MMNAPMIMATLTGRDAIALKASMAMPMPSPTKVSSQALTMATKTSKTGINHKFGFDSEKNQAPNKQRTAIGYRNHHF